MQHLFDIFSTENQQFLPKHEKHFLVEHDASCAMKAREPFVSFLKRELFDIRIAINLLAKRFSRASVCYKKTSRLRVQHALTCVARSDFEDQKNLRKKIRIFLLKRAICAFQRAVFDGWMVLNAKSHDASTMRHRIGALP